ncbi:MAG: bis(5'-nucleosyl)-tetraphosphatase (symmetrical) YqeK [Lachnospiraceae bacterium]|nr:bis(5'-nucleosyl)-tetraphosphatase (symmetrical) YqeK [Lachnospiraceae bacterium]
MCKEYFYDDKFIYTLYKKMEKKLKHHRYIHSIGVAGISSALAMKYGEDVYKAQIAGILHDCAKSFPDSQLIKLCRKNNIEISDFEEKHGFLLHAKYGAYLAETKYGIKDEDIINSIRWHTTGRKNMSLLEKILFISDYIEPTRFKAVNLNKIREKVFNGNDIDEVLLMIMGDTIDYLSKYPEDIDETTKTAFEYYKKKVGS